MGGVTEQVTGEVGRLLAVMAGEMRRKDMQNALSLRHEEHFREAYLVPALSAGVIEMTIPYKPQSSKQKYRLTQKGRDIVAKLVREAEAGGLRKQRYRQPYIKAETIVRVGIAERKTAPTI